MTDAQTTVAPGIYDAMSAGDYHAIDAISATTLIEFGGCDDAQGES